MLFSAGTAIGLEPFVRRLRIYAHALRERNAYYSPDKKALLFGYFPAGMLGAELSLRVILALRGPQRGRAGAGEAAWARIPAAGRCKQLDRGL